MSYCSRSRRRRFTLLDFKSWAYSRIYGHFWGTFVLRMRRNGYLWTSGVNFDTAVPFARPRFPAGVQTFGDLATFSVEFCILYVECSPYFYFRFVSPTDIESIPHASTPTSIIPTKFEVPTPIPSGVMSDDVSHWLPSKMRTRPVRMRRITWPVSRGSKTITFFFESPTPIFLFTIQLLLGYDDDKGSFTLERHQCYSP